MLIFLMSSNDISTIFFHLYCFWIYKKPLELSFPGSSVLWLTLESESSISKFLWHLLDLFFLKLKLAMVQKSTVRFLKYFLEASRVTNHARKKSMLEFGLCFDHPLWFPGTQYFYCVKISSIWNYDLHSLLASKRCYGTFA